MEKLIIQNASFDKKNSWTKSHPNIRKKIKEKSICENVENHSLLNHQEREREGEKKNLPRLFSVLVDGF